MLLLLLLLLLLQLLLMMIMEMMTTMLVMVVMMVMMVSTTTTMIMMMMMMMMMVMCHSSMFLPAWKWHSTSTSLGMTAESDQTKSGFDRTPKGVGWLGGQRSDITLLAKSADGGG